MNKNQQQKTHKPAPPQEPCSVVLSAPGATVFVEQYRLTPELRAALSVGNARLVSTR